jgi:acetyl esterase/lipase
MVMGGESAGAYLAALTMLRVRDELGTVDKLAGANLVFGIYDLSGTPSQYGVVPSEAPDIISADTFESTLQAYTPGRTRLDVRHPSVSPMYARLHDMPPALFTVGSADHLLDDSLFMSRRWEAWGNEVELAVYPDCPHAFLGRGSELAAHAAQRIDDFLERCFQ